MPKINIGILQLLALGFSLLTPPISQAAPPEFAPVADHEADQNSYQKADQNLQHTGTKQNNLCLSQLPGAIAQVINQENLDRSQLGILVTRLDNNQELYNFHGDLPLIPGSNLKLLTSAATLHYLGANFRIRTSIYDRGNNSLLVIGRGDPSLNQAQLQSLGQQLRSHGKTTINILAGDDRYFQGEPFNPAWMGADIESGEAPAVSSLAVNPVQSSLPIREPSIYFMQSFRAELNSLGLLINQTRLRRGRSPVVISSTWREIAAVESPPLGELLKEVNANSNIFYAEMLTRQLGKIATGDDRHGLATVQNVLSNLGVDRKSYSLVDASGLAAQNRVSPRAIVQTLYGMIVRSPQAETYVNSLALAGETGTLHNRLLNTPAEGNFRGKSGTLVGVSALSGYLETDYGLLIVSIMVNNPQQSTPSLRRGIDRIVEQISRLNFCSS